MSDVGYVSTGEPKKEWNVTENVAEIKKNKFDTIRIQKVDFGGSKLISMQTWRQDGMRKYAVKESRIAFSEDLKDKIVEALNKC
jgi:hypothetical protein